jgi:hypothetical protein
MPVVVLSNASDGPLPTVLARKLDDFRLARSFQVNEDVFKYTVGVRIYQPSSSQSVAKCILLCSSDIMLQSQDIQQHSEKKALDF